MKCKVIKCDKPANLLCEGYCEDCFIDIKRVRAILKRQEEERKQNGKD